MFLPTVSYAQKITKSIVGSSGTSRIEACSAAKNEARRWVEWEVGKPLASALVDGRKWEAQFDRYSDCDCETVKTVTGNEFKCMVDATIKSK